MEGESNYTIHRVHRQLREQNPDAYEPKMLAIGPYHHGKNDLKMMEYHKCRYFHLLCQRINKSFENFHSIIAPLEGRARMCYAEPVGLGLFSFIEMLIIDGCFILEFVLNGFMNEFRREHDPFLDLPWIRRSIKRDLMLLENQIPFFVLCELCDLITNVPNQHRELANLFLLLFEDMNRLAGKVQLRSIHSSDVKHLLDMIYRNWYPDEVGRHQYSREDQYQNIFGSSTRLGDLEACVRKKREMNSSEKERMLFIESASRLEEADVKFRRKETMNLFELEFENGTISMPPLAIHDGIESLISNLIVHEIYSYDQSTESSKLVLDYVHLLNCLIDSSKDIEILCGNKIIEKCLDDKKIIEMFHRLDVSVAAPAHRFFYTEIFERVNEHCQKRRNRWMAKLRRNYLNSPWAIISVIAATILLLLTVVQTVFSILQVV